MQIFTLNKTTYKNGKLINGIKSATWVERYNGEGEFTITCEPTVDLRFSLLVGNLISHQDSKTIMMVENHEITEDSEGTPSLVVTGRSIDQIMMENRVITLSDHESDAFVDDLCTYPLEFNLSVAGIADQAVILLQRYLQVATYSEEERIPNFQVINYVDMVDPAPVSRVLSRLSLLSSAVRELLDTLNCGLKIERPNSSHPNTMQLILHNGEDRSSTVVFDYFAGDLESARYLWTNKDTKNSAIVATDNYAYKAFRPGVSGLDLRIMPIDASDWQRVYDPLTPTDREAVKQVLAGRAYQELSKHKFGTFVDATIKKNSKYIYGVDYNIGDIVYVIGNYGIEEKFRVIEFAQTFDEDGEYSFPTLKPIV